MSISSSASSMLRERIALLMPVVEYRNMLEPEDKEAAYRLRYDAYRRENRIQENPQRLSHDFLDEVPNAQTFGVFVAGKLASSIRLNMVTSACPHSISMVSNQEFLEAKLANGVTFIDPSRFVIDLRSVCDFPELPYLTMRLPVMACLHFGVDECLTLVRPEHHSFYRRIFRSTAIAEPVYLEMLNMNVQLMSSGVDDIHDELDDRYPFFRSNHFERRRLFGRKQDMIGFGEPDQFIAA